MADVFVSYAREDQARVRPLVETLENAGFSVWWDRSLEPGTSWTDVIDGELRRARCVVVVWSAAAVGSRWVSIEANEARRRGILVPVAMEPVVLGDEFAQIHRLEWFGQSEDQLASTLLARVGTVTRRSRRRSRAPIVALLIAAVVLGLGALAWINLQPDPRVVAPQTIQTEPAPLSIAVLPFVESSSADLEPGLGEGIALELITALAEISDLRVVARLASWTLPDDLAVADVRGRLGVAWIVEGDVSASADEVRVRVRLIDSDSGMLEGSWEHQAIVDDLSSIRRQITRRIVAALPRSELTLPESLFDSSVDGAAYRFHLLGRALLRDERSADSRVRAESYFQRALEIDTDYAEAHAGLCEVRMWRYDDTRDAADLELAGQLCEQARIRAPDSHYVLLALGRLALLRGMADTAQTAFEKLLRRNPADADSRVGLAQALAMLGESAAAEIELRRAIADQPGYWAPHNALAHFLLQQGRADESVRDFIIALDLAPDEPNALNNLGAAMLMTDELPAAIRAFQRALALGETPGATSNLGTAYYLAARFADAAATFERATALTPTDYRIWGNLADAWSIIGDPRANEAYAQAEALARGDLTLVEDDAALRIGIENFRAARGVGSIRDLDAALEARTPTWETEYLAAVALNRLGAPDRAAEYLKDAIDLGFPESMAHRDPLIASLMTEVSTQDDTIISGDYP